jgi:hypothetical protein
LFISQVAQFFSLRVVLKKALASQNSKREPLDL